jgi:PAS domain S-box-containing protein
VKKTYKKTEEKLTSEGTELRQPVAQLEAPATDHMQTGQLLRKTEVDDLAVLNSISELVAYQDSEHRVIWTNKAAAESVGLTPERLVGRYCYAIWPQRSQPCEGCPVVKARQTGKPQKAEITTPDGRTWSIRGYPVLDANDCVVGAVEVTLDLTERKKAEQALADEATRRHILVDQSLDGIVILDENARVYEANQKFAEMLGYTPEEVRELHTWDWDTQWSREELLEMGRKVDETGYHLETCHRRKDGSVIDVDISINGAVIAGQKLIFCVCRDVTERKQMEKKLQASEKTKSAVLNATPDLIAVANEEGTLFDINKAMAERFRKHPEELTGSNGWDLIPPELAESRKRCFNEVFQTGKPCRFEDENGGIYFDNIVYPVMEEQGKVTRVAIQARDITERKKAEDKMQTIIKTALDGFWLTDLKGKILEVNDSYCKMTGYTREELLKMSISDLEALESPEATIKHIKNLMSKGYERFESRHKRKDGKIIDVEVSSNYLDVGQGQLFVFARDITERKQAEQALRENEEKLERMFESVTDGISVVDLNSVITEVNQRTVEMHGLGSKDELVGKNAFDLVAPRDREKIARNIGEVIKHGTISGIEYTLLKSDGSEFPAELSTSALKDAYGKVIGHITVARDITERKQAEERLNESEERFRIASQIASDVVYERDLQTGIATFYGDIDSHFGYEPGEYPRTMEGWREHVHPEDIAWIDNQSIDQMEPGVPYSIEYRMRKKDGTYMTWLDKVTLICDKKTGRPLKFLGAATDITERKQAEEALRESEEKYKELAESITDVFFAFDKDLKYTYWNKASEKLVGISAENALGKHLYDVFPDSEMTRKAEKVYLKALRTQKVHSFVSEYQLGGRDYFFEISAYPSKNGLSVFTRDITDRKQAEEALQAGKNKLQSLIDALGDNLGIQDKDYNIIYQNEPSKKNLGDHLGEKCYRAYEGKDEVDEDCPVKKAFKDGKSHTSERRVVALSGEVVYIETTANPIRDAGGEIVTCLEVGRNITERKKAEQALKESEDFSSSLLTNSPNPMLVINQDTSVRYTNPALEKLTGFSIKEIIGRKAPYPWWTEETLRKTAKDLDQAMRQGARRLEELFQKKNGELFWVEITSTPVTSDGEFKYYLANWVDITERKRAAEREQEMQRELLLSSRLASIGELAAGVAHQINNPLTGVLGFSQRLLKKSTDQEAQQDLKIIYTEAERAAKVVQNLLTFARRRQPRKQYSDINEILESALELRAYELKTSNIEVTTNLAPELPEIMLDFYQIQEVFLNIILNAEQALTEAHSGGKLTIKTEKRKGYIRTTFTDDGPGIPAERLNNIFDPFYTTKGEKGGTGLGLSVCHGIITEHGGKIYAKNKPGKGATFFVELPLNSN